MISPASTSVKSRKQPPFELLYNRLLTQIKEGALTERIPSINELSEEFSVSIATVKKAIDKLKNQNILYGQKGKAIFVNPDVFGQPLFQRHIVIFIQENLCRNSFYLRVINELRNLLEGDQSVVHFVNSFPQLGNASGADIVVVMDMESPEEIARVNAAVPPERTIFLNCRPGQRYNVGTDNFAGGCMAIETLYAAGHRHIGIISRDTECRDSFFYRRYCGAISSTERHPDLKLYNYPLPRLAGYCDERDGDQVAELLLTNHPAITAIFAFTDILALGVYNYCNRNSRRIPEEISVIGFDDKEFSPVLYPALTSIREDSEAISSAIVRIMAGIVSGNSAPCQLQCLPTLVARDSVSVIQPKEFSA